MVQLVPDTAECTLFLEGQAGTDYAGAEAQFSIYVRDTVGVWNTAQLTKLATYLRDWFTTGKNAGAAGRSTLTGDWFGVKTLARSLDVDPSLTAELTFSSQGTRSGDTVPAGVSVLVKYGMSPGAFPKRARTFWPGGNNTDLLQNNWTSTYLTEIVARFTDLDADIGDPTAGGDVNWAQVRVSRSSGTVDDPTPRKIAVPRATGLTNTIAARTARALWASQRDRRPGE